MSEQRQSSQRLENLKRAVVAATLGVAALAGCTQPEAPASPPPVAENAPATDTSSEQLASLEASKDAAAALQIAGSILANAGGQSVYNGEAVDNWGESDMKPTDRASVQVVRTAANSTITLLASDPNGYTLNMQMIVDPSDPFMQTPLTTESLTAGPSSANVVVGSASYAFGGEPAQTQLYALQGGQLHDSSNAPLTARRVTDLNQEVLAKLADVAAASGMSYADLPAAAVQELQT